MSESSNNTMIEKAAENLFTLCDKEGKGHLTKSDMNRLRTELQEYEFELGPEELDNVFESLDHDGDGCLTHAEFIEGFGKFLGFMNGDPSDMEKSVFEADETDAAETDMRFHELMEVTGAHGMFDNAESIKDLWSHLHKDNPELLGNFEEFLYKVTHDIRLSQSECCNMENVLKSKTNAHDDEVKRLYEEMEAQLRQEREHILSEEKAKERQLRDEMERELSDKDKQLQELIMQQQELEAKLNNHSSMGIETKIENDRLEKEKESLEAQLLSIQDNYDESQAYISQLRQQQKQEKRQRARSALQLTEGIAIERETLVKQLDLLRDINKQLRDEKDVAESAQFPLSSLYHILFDKPTLSILEELASVEDSPERSSAPHLKEKKALTKQGSVMSNYFGSTDSGNKNRPQYEYFTDSEVEEENDEVPNLITNDITDDDDIECDESLLNDGHDTSYTSSHPDLSHVSPMSPPNLSRVSEDILCNTSQISFPDVSHLNSHLDTTHISTPTNASHSFEVISLSNVSGVRSRNNKHSLSEWKKYRESDSDSAGTKVAGGLHRKLRRSKRKSDTSQSSKANGVLKPNDIQEMTIENEFDPNSPRIQPVGCTSTSLDKQEIRYSIPERVFKIVFVGDSGVGKSSFIHRFCNDTFKTSFSATIGVDFQVKSILVEGHVIAMQLWDTAGQERYRSITKQYFRKADGVLLMYDVASETSFMNLRNWMTSVHDGVEDGTLLMICGNKIDLIDEESNRVVKTKDGERLADEYGTLFMETSAKSGTNIAEAMEALASVLKKKKVPTATLR